MYEVRVEAEFAAAHFLKDFHGKCERLHGQTIAFLPMPEVKALTKAACSLILGS